MFLAALLPIVLLAQDPLPKADPDITRAALLHHLKFLASDELKGRGTATPESARASACTSSRIIGMQASMNSSRVGYAEMECSGLHIRLATV